MSMPMREASPDTDAIRQWLRAHPEFLIEHPDLLAELVIPHATSAVSLIERQVELLRAENRRLKRRLEQLTAIAAQNERLMQRLHRVSLRLVTSSSITELTRQLRHALGEEFQADAMRLLLKTERLGPDAGATDPGSSILAAWPTPAPDWLEALLDEGVPQCGRLTRAKREQLFGDSADEIGSAALVPIAEVGLLAIGARSDERFQPDLGTLFLGMLAEALALRLNAANDAPIERAASA